MYKFKSANVYYGIAQYDMHILASNPEFAIINGVPDRASLVEAIAFCIGALEFEEVNQRMTTLKVIPEIDMPELNIKIPETIQARGNGFSVVWEKV